MSDALLVALVMGIMAFLGQWLLKRQDYKRQDQVAARVEQVARDAKVTNTKLDVIHGLVNSNLTASKAAELHALESLLVLQEREATDAEGIETTKAQIAQLHDDLAERARQADSIVDKIAETESDDR